MISIPFVIAAVVFALISLGCVTYIRRKGGTVLPRRKDKRIKK